MNLPPLLHYTTLVEATIDGLQPRMRNLISYVVEIGSIHLHCFIGLQTEARLGQ